MMVMTISILVVNRNCKLQPLLLHMTFSGLLFVFLNNAESDNSDCVGGEISFFFFFYQVKVCCLR